MPSSSDTAIAAGMRILCRDAEWLVTRVSPADRAGKQHAIHCIGADDLVRGQERIFLEQLDSMELVDPRKTELVPDTSSGYRMARLFLEAQLRQMPVTGIDPDLEGMGVFEPMEYQRQAVHRALLQLRPRLLLADAVGLGKTIEVGMIITELMRRGRANRILVLAKKSMLTQFQSELWNRFGVPLVRLDSVGIARLRLRIPANKNPFEVYHRIIISIDTLKDVGRYRHFLEETRWDVVVIDEAHNVAGASVPERHLSHRLARLLARRTDSLLLTTATPHNGQRETFGRLISLLDPSAIPDPRLKEYEAEDIREFFMMRFKEDVREEAGENFQDRQVVPVAQTSEDASADEEDAFAVLAQARQDPSSSGDRSEEITALMQYGLYKLYLSSPEACLSGIRERLREKPSNKRPLSEGERLYLEKLQGTVSGQSLGESSRYSALKRQLDDLGWRGSKTCPRVLVFTEYRHTQSALVTALAKDFGLKYSKEFDKQPDQTIGVIHGGVPDVHLMKTVESFGTGSSPMRMLIATDVASEGINLHHECHNIIHYDLPWSIITLIQRNGRIDRFGQRRTPCLRYLMVNSQQEQLAGDRDIFARLIDKVEEINRSTRSGESVLKLYDPEAEERYVAEKGILAGNVDVLENAPTATVSVEAGALEEVLRAATKEGTDSYLEFLLGEKDAPVENASKPDERAPSRLRLYSDRGFLAEGYRYLAELSRDYRPLQEDGHMLTLDAPKDLSRRLGSPHVRDDVVFGSTAIPSEAWPEHEQFLFTDDLHHANLAIQAARNTAGHWAKTHMIMEQHPVVQWVAERLVMVMKRGQAPHIRSKHLEPGELCFCFIGQVSSKAGTPLVVDAHAISFGKDGKFRHRSLAEALDAAQFKNLINKGEFKSSGAATPLIPAAVDASLEHMQAVKRNRDAKMAPLLRKETRRLRNWRKRRVELLQRLIAAGDSKSKRWKREIEEINAYLKDREQNWQQTYFDATAQPSTRLVLVIEGGEE